MNNRLLRNLTAALLIASSSMGFAQSANADIIVGLPPDANTGNCAPFGCSYSGQFQQVYTAGAFSGPITIADLEFFNTAVNTGANSMNFGIWTISLSTTSADWNTLSGTHASNLGADNTVVFSGNLSQPWVFGKEITRPLLVSILVSISLPACVCARTMSTGALAACSTGAKLARRIASAMVDATPASVCARQYFTIWRVM